MWKQQMHCIRETHLHCNDTAMQACSGVAIHDTILHVAKLRAGQFTYHEGANDFQNVQPVWHDDTAAGLSRTAGAQLLDQQQLYLKISSRMESEGSQVQRRFPNRIAVLHLASCSWERVNILKGKVIIV